MDTVERAGDKGERPRLDAVQALELTSDGFISLDRDFRITYMNRAAAELNGIHPSQAIGKTNWEQWPASAGTEIERNYRHAMETGQPVHFETYYHDEGTLEVWVDLHVYPADGGLAIFFRDITEKKKSEKALRDALAREEARVQELNALMESVPAAIWLMEDLEGNRITGSRLSYELLRLTQGANASVTAPQDERPANFRVFQGKRELKPDELPVQRAAWQNEEIRDFQFDVVFEDGERRHLYGNAAPLRNADGSARGSIAAFMDVTDLYRTQAELRASYDRLAMTLNAAQAGTWEWDARTGERRWSPEFYSLFAIDPTEPPDLERAHQKLHPEDLPILLSAVEEALATKQDLLVDFRIHHPEHGLRWVSSFGRLDLDESGNVVGVRGIALDITDRKLLQNELEDRVRQRTEEMEGFTYSVSHDLRAPLRSIVATSRILLAEAGEALQDEHRKMLERQVFNSNRLANLIDDLLKMSRLAREQVVRAELDLSELAAEIGEEISSGKRFRLDIEPGMRACGDGRLVRLLLQNLVENAVKFSPEDGCVRFGRVASAPEPTFYVADQGIGFDMQYVGKLFRPFERLVGDRDFPGTGIGLANVHRIVTKHGGRVWAESEGLGKGATFYFTLP